MATGSSGAGSHPACASCRHQRKKCPKDCIMAPFFPAEDDSRSFGAVQKVFGVSNVQKMIGKVDSMEDRRRVAQSIVWDARNWEKYPVDGSLGLYSRLREENKRLLEENKTLKEKNGFLENQLLQYSQENNKLKEEKGFLENELLQHNATTGGGFDAWSNATDNKGSNILRLQEHAQPSLTPFSQHYPPQAGLWPDFHEQIDGVKTGYSSTADHHLSIDPNSFSDPTALIGHMNSDPVAWEAKTLTHLNSNSMAFGAVGHPCSNQGRFEREANIICSNQGQFEREANTICSNQGQFERAAKIICSNQGQFERAPKIMGQPTCVRQATFRPNCSASKN